MPNVTMPDGTVVNMPDPEKLNPGEIDHLKSVLNQIEMAQNKPGLPSWQQIGTEAAKGTARYGIPMAAQTAGLIGGMAVGGPLLGGALEAAGGAGGEALVQQLGLAEPSKTNIALGAIAPPAGRLAGAAIRGAPLTTAGLFGGRELLGSAAEAGFKKKLLPGPTSSEMISLVRGNQTPIPLGEIEQTIQGIFKKETGQAQTTVRKEIESQLKPILDFVKPPTEELPLSRPFVGISKGREIQGRTIPKSYAAPQTFDLTADQLFTESTRLRRAAFTASDPDISRALYQTRQSMLDSLEHGGVPVKAALQKYKKEEAVDQLGLIALRPQPGRIFKETLAKDNYFNTAFTDAEKEEIAQTMKKLAFTSPSGSRGMVGRSAVKFMGGGEIGGTIAGLTIPEIIGSTLSSKQGRGLLEYLLTSSGNTLYYPGLALLSQFVRIQAGQP